MSGLGDLLRSTQAQPPRDLVGGEPSIPTLRLPRSAHDEAVSGIVDFFSHDAGRTIVYIVHGGTGVGYLTRTRLLEFVGMGAKDFGGSVGATLAGKPTTIDWIELRCPIEGCPSEPQYTMVYDEDEPSRCVVHPDQELRVVP